MSAIRNPNLGPSQMRQKRRRLFFIRLYIILFFILVIILGLAIFSGSKKVTIQTIIVSGNAAVSSDDVLAVANRDMTGRYWYLFARNNSLIFPRFQIENDLLTEIKTIKEVNINLDNWQQISIKITERKPHSVWCGQDIKSPDLKCSFVDKDGFVYGPAPVFSGNMFIRFYGNIPITQIYSEIFSLIELLNKNNMKVVAVSYDNFDYKFILENGPEIIFNDKNPFVISFDNLFRAIETKNLDLENNASVIKYIDLRFDNKIVVGKK